GPAPRRTRPGRRGDRPRGPASPPTGPIRRRAARSSSSTSLSGSPDQDNPIARGDAKSRGSPQEPPPPTRATDRVERACFLESTFGILIPLIHKPADTFRSTEALDREPGPIAARKPESISGFVYQTLVIRSKHVYLVEARPAPGPHRPHFVKKGA